MNAISTKFHGPTNTRGSRITATDPNGNRASVPYPHEVSEGLRAHAVAAVALARKLGWTGTLVGGATATGYAFVWASDAETFEVRA